MKRVLVVAYYFPPLGGIGSLRLLKFANYLPEFGWEPTVLTPRNGAYHRDPSLAFPEERTVRTFSFEISRAGKRVTGVGGDDEKPAHVPLCLRQLRDFARRWIYRPDAQVGFFPLALVAGRRVLRERRFDAIFSSSFPVTAHLVAMRLHRELAVPWVAEFRDPWTDLTPYDSARRKALDETTERAILDTAAALVTVSEDWRDLYVRRGARRVFVITNGFDPDDYPPAEPPDPPVITFLGTYYPDRQDLETPLRALGNLRRSGRLGDFTLRFVGDMPPALVPVVTDAGLADVTAATGYVSHREALGHVARSSLLLLAGPRNASGPIRGQIPAKVFEYLGALRPILYVGDLRSDVARLLETQPGVARVVPGDMDAASRALADGLDGPARVDRPDLGPFTRRALTRRLADVLEGVSRPTSPARREP